MLQKIGGGQAGLAISYYLTQEGREHVVLERLF
jgi:cation diffusion facilitator CzcD-associated flavoprotein CzcO